MNMEESFCDSTYENHIHLAERELSAFIGAVAKLFGPEQAECSTEDWFDESDLMDGPPGSTSRDWRAVTVAASARLASRLAVAQHRGADLRVGAKDSWVLRGSGSRHDGRDEAGPRWPVTELRIGFEPL
jgi:hypothetical protein